MLVLILKIYPHKGYFSIQRASFLNNFIPLAIPFNFAMLRQSQSSEMRPITTPSQMERGGYCR